MDMDARDRERWRRCEMRAEVRADVPKRTITGIAVRYAEPTTILPGVEEQIERGAFADRIDPAANVNYQHRREMPLALPRWEDGEDAMRVSFVLPPGARQDQALADASAGLLRGLSIEYYPEPRGEWAERVGDADRYHITAATLVGVAMVDQPAYDGSRYEIRRRYAARSAAAPRRRTSRRSRAWAYV